MPIDRNAQNMRHEHCGTVDHGRVDDLALAAALRFEEGTHHAVGEEHAAAAEVADHVERRYRRLAGPAEVREGAGERDVVDVVAGGLGVRAFLPPAGHAPEHELRVAGEALVGADAEPFHHARAEPFDERIGRARRGSSSASTPSGCFRSIATLRRPRSKTS